LGYDALNNSRLKRADAALFLYLYEDAV